LSGDRASCATRRCRSAASKKVCSVRTGANAIGGHCARLIISSASPATFRHPGGARHLTRVAATRTTRNSYVATSRRNK
jgi:hypothetical protein